MTDNIFNQGTDQVPNEAPVVQQPVIPPELQEFVGAGKKYASLDDVYKAFPHAQKHISTLEEENRQIKEELQRRKTAEELLEEIQNRAITPQESVTTPPSIPDISSLVRQEIQRTQAEQVSLANQHEVVNKFTALYGDKAQVQFEQLANELGVPITSLNQLAATSPKALFKLAGIDQSKSTSSGTLQSDVNLSAGNIPQANDKITVGLNGGAREDAAAIKKARELILKQYT
jgi:hypothetical protein